MHQKFVVTNRRESLKLIPYVGCKSGFSHIFDSLVPDNYGKKIYDLFGGGGAFAFYACSRFGSKNVVFNDHNPTITNLFEALKTEPDSLYAEYLVHRSKSSKEYYLKMRGTDLNDGVAGAGRFFYLAKNAFSGKIRFNSKNEFNSPMRKNAKCPNIDKDALDNLSRLIKNMKITNRDFLSFRGVRQSFLYLDPPYMNNTNGHYNATVPIEAFSNFVKKMESANKLMISEQNDPGTLGLARDYRVFQINLKRSLQYFTQEQSKEIIAINYAPP